MRIIRLLFLLSLVQAATAAPGAADPRVIRVGLSTSLYATVNEHDARIATQLWANELTEQMEEDWVLDVVLFNDTQVMLAATIRGEVDFINLHPIDFVTRGKDLTPALTSVYHDGRSSERFCLIVRQDAGLVSLQDLQGKRCLMVMADDNHLPRMWLEVALRHDGLQTADQHLRLESVEEPSQGVLRVLFGQADACVAPDHVLTTMSELNPQLARELNVLSVSDEFLRGLGLFGPLASQDKRRAVLQASLQIHERPTGRQLLALYGFSSVHRFEPSQLISVRDLVAEHARVTGP